MATTLRIPVIPNQKDGTIMAAKDKDDFGDDKTPVTKEPVVKKADVVDEVNTEPTTEDTAVSEAEKHVGQIPVYNINDGPTGRNGGPYLDQLSPAHMQLVTGPALIIAHGTPSHIHTGPITAPIQGWITDPEYKADKADKADTKEEK